MLTTLIVALGAGTASAQAPAPTHDSVVAVSDSGTHFVDGSTGKHYTFEIFAGSGPAGEGARGAGIIVPIVNGEYDLPNAIGIGEARCVRVEGNRAVVGLHHTQSVYVFMEDNGTYAATADRIEFVLTDVAPTVGSCPAPRQPANPLSPYTDTSGNIQWPNDLTGGNLTIVDAHPLVVNQPPVAVDDAYAVTGGGVLTVAAPGVLSNDSDADGDALSAQVVLGPASGDLALAADGSLTYTPGEDAVSGVVTFTYRAFDGQAYSGPATVRITVTAGCDGRAASIVGTAGNDILSGTGGDDVIVALGGDDRIDPGSGHDRVCGGSGADVVAGGSGDDRVFGGSGDDRLDGGSGLDRLFGEAGVDRLFGGGDADALDGGAGSPDRCDGEGGSDTATACEQTMGVP